MKALRGRLTGKDRDLITLGLDRVLWSVAWTVRTALPFSPAEFILEDAELHELARLSLVFNSEVNGDRVDRVFLNRATEHLLVRRLRLREIAHRPLAKFLERLADEDWIAYPYGLHVEADHEDHSEDGASFDERGCHTKYTAGFEPSPEEVDSLAAALKATRQRARAQKQIPLLDTYALSPSLWLGSDPQSIWGNTPEGEVASTLRCLHRYLSLLSELGNLVPSATGDSANEGEHFQTRALVMQALRRAVFRDSVLLRLLPQRADLNEAGWGELLATAFFANLPDQHESMAGRINVFLEDLNAASGAIADPTSARGGLYQATRLRDQQFVALVKGGGGGNTAVTRDRIFNGFNTPLLPEVLVCTSVGQEGIDLHRHCRHVIHYDLAWNPAVLEQRTGRTDRIGSKTFRERATSGKDSVFLEIGVPFLAGTYDERMYEELRLRSQTFEVLTGGEFAADHAVGDDNGSEIASAAIGAVFPLPPSLIEDLRVRFQVWSTPPAAYSCSHALGQSSKG